MKDTRFLVPIGPFTVEMRVSSDTLRAHLLRAHLLEQYSVHRPIFPQMASLHVALEPGTHYVDLARVPIQVRGRQFFWSHATLRFIVDVGKRQGALSGTSAHPLAVLEYALRSLVALSAWQQDALLVHASAVGVGNKAVLFIGPSGSGKSTAAHLRPRHLPLLADDLVLTQWTHRRWLAWPTPFTAKAMPDTYEPMPIGLICVLKHASSIDLRPLSPSAILTHVVQSLPLVTYSRDALPRILTLLQSALSHVQVAALHFPPTPAFWTVILKTLDQNRHE